MLYVIRTMEGIPPPRPLRSYYCRGQQVFIALISDGGCAERFLWVRVKREPAAGECVTCVRSRTDEWGCPSRGRYT